MVDFRSQAAREIVREKLAEELTVSTDEELSTLRTFAGNASATPILLEPVEGEYSPHHLPRDVEQEKVTNPEEQTPPLEEGTKVCIVGAGIAGLYIALILDSLDIPNLSYDILEASDRVGGRIYTYNFTNTKHDYYDIGAMRFPDIPIMKRTFDLFDKMNIKPREYYLDGVKVPKMFNDRLWVQGDTTAEDPFKVSVKNSGEVPDDVVDKVDDLLENAFKPFKDAMKKDHIEGFKKLMTVDDFSTREFLRRKGKDPVSDQGYDFPTVQWMETQDTSSGLFDQAFTESVMDSFDFSYAPGVKWHCIEGGTSLVTDAMQRKIQEKNKANLELNKRVKAIMIDRDAKDAAGEKIEKNMSVQCAGEDQVRDGYSTVFSTTTLGCLKRMDLTSLQLHPSLKDGIRCLHYDHSVKVAIKFKNPWWITKCGIVKGGVASTDLSLRTCVYPSYNIDDDKTKPAVLLVSYTWAQDASRISSLVTNPKRSIKNPDSELMELILRDLAKLHERHIDEKTIRELYVEHHEFSWSDDPYTSGAFALFGPGQFKHLYPHLSSPAAESKFHIVGEASSVHHAWVVGALNSAQMSVSLFLRKFNQWEYLEKLEEIWGKVDELETGVHGTDHLKLLLGMQQNGEWVSPETL